MRRRDILKSWLVEDALLWLLNLWAISTFMLMLASLLIVASYGAR